MENQYDLGFIGGGRVSWFLLESLNRKNAFPDKVIVYDPNQDCSDRIMAIEPSKITCSHDKKWIASAKNIFLAVHPPVIKDVVMEIKNEITDNSVLISLAPVFSIAKLTELLGGFNRIVRMIPNAPTIVNQGYNPVAFSDAIPIEEKTKLLTLFRYWGESPEVEESKLEAYAIIIGMGPTYFWPQWMELMRLGSEFGLNEKELLESMPAMLHGAVSTLFASGLSYSNAMDLIPVYPLKDRNEQILQCFKDNLSALYKKLSGKE